MKNHTLILLIIWGLMFSCGKKNEETTPVVKDITETVFASGNLEAENTYNLTAQSDGYILDIAFQENDLVAKGQLLATIDNKQNLFNSESSAMLYDIARSNNNSNSPLLVQARNSMKVAKQQMEYDSLQALRFKNLLAAKSIALTDYEAKTLKFESSKTDFLNAVENYNQQKKLAEQDLVINQAQKNVNAVLSGFNEIKALFDGKVYKRFKERGDFVRTGDVIASIGDPKKMYARVSIDESSIEKVKIGQEAVIQLNTDKDKVFKGKVAEILPSFNEETQSFTAKIHFTEPMDFGIINTQLQVNIIVGETKDALLIPRRFLGYGNMVTVKGQKEPVRVQTKIVSSEWVQIESGIDINTVLIADKRP